MDTNQTVQVTFTPDASTQQDASTQPNALRKVTFSSSSINFSNAAPGTVTFNLMNPALPAVQARFPSNPIQWVRRIVETNGDIDTNLQPTDKPSEAKVSRLDDGTTLVTIIPAASGPNTLPAQTFRFYVIVQTTNGDFFGTDPTIITMPPG